MTVPAPRRPSWKSPAAAVLAFALAACGGPKTVAAPVPPTVIGINVGMPDVWGSERSLGNMAAMGPLIDPTNGWHDAPADWADAQGWPLVPNTHHFVFPFTRMLPGETSYTCTWQGKGLVLNGGVGATSSGDHRFTKVTDSKGTHWAEYSEQPGGIRALDCREPSVPKDAEFAPEFIREVQPFKVIRFMDWTGVNANKGGDWSKRKTRASATQAGPEGVSVEIMIDLVNQLGADPWLNIPYKADDTYIEGEARYVHDHLRPGGRVYVELGNEIWNDSFPAAQQAAEEGVAEHLSADRGEAKMRRYAEKAVHAFKIWTQVFSDRPNALVRVLATQNAWAPTAETALSFRDTAAWVDALATAPYFNLDWSAPDAPHTPDAVFARLDDAVDKALGDAASSKGVAQKYGKRFIAYEGGQGLTTSDAALLTAVERDPRMAAAYTRFLDGWRDRIGDLLVLYQLDGGIGAFGAWGLREYTGQPLGEAPKARAVQDFLAH